MDSGEVQWIIWFILCGVSFLILEFVALNGHPENTLSSKLRYWLGIYPQKTRRHALVPIFIAVILAIPMWLAAHLLY